MDRGIIAHRLATVKKVSRIIVLEHGRIVEIGAPEAEGSFIAFCALSDTTALAKARGLRFILQAP